MVGSCLSARGNEFSLKLVRVGFVVDKIALVQVFRQLLQFSPGIIVHFIASTHFFICHDSCVIVTIGGIIKYSNFKECMPKSSLYHVSSSLLCGPGSSVGIATGYWLDGPGIESRWGRDCPHLSRPALGPTQPPIQWVPDLSRGQRAAGA